jgi:hypothetical protein
MPPAVIAPPEVKAIRTPYIRDISGRAWMNNPLTFSYNSACEENSLNLPMSIT